MAITSTTYNSYKKALLDKVIDHTNDTIKIALLSSSYTPNYDTHTVFDDLTNEISGTGYTAGGFSLAGMSTSQDNTDDEGVWDATDNTNSTTTISSARYAVIYQDTGDTSTSRLMICYDLGADFSSVGGDFSFLWNSEGIINVN